jgi:hypothetical protein
MKSMRDSLAGMVERVRAGTDTIASVAANRRRQPSTCRPAPSSKPPRWKKPPPRWKN